MTRGFWDRISGTHHVRRLRLSRVAQRPTGISFLIHLKPGAHETTPHSALNLRAKPSSLNH